MNEWMNTFCEFLKVPLIPNLAWENTTLCPTPTPNPPLPPPTTNPPPLPTLTNQDSLSVPACQVHFITRSFGSCQHVLARLIQRKRKKKKGWGRNEKKNATLPFPRANLFTETILCRWSAACLKSGLKRRRSSDVCAYINAPLFVIIYRLLCVIGSQG